MIQISIQTYDFEVDEFYYSFKYDVWVNGKHLFKKAEYESDHSHGDDIKDFKNTLKKYYAHQIVLEQISNEI